MASMRDIIRKQEELRDALKNQIAELQNKLAGVEMALQTAKGDNPLAATARLQQPRSNVKNILLRMLEEVGPSGLNAATAVEMASKRNEALERPSVSSLLSRFKSDGVVTYDGTVYRLKKYAPAQEGGPVH